MNHAGKEKDGAGALPKSEVNIANRLIQLHIFRQKRLQAVQADAREVLRHFLNIPDTERGLD